MISITTNHNSQNLNFFSLTIFSQKGNNTIQILGTQTKTFQTSYKNYSSTLFTMRCYKFEMEINFVLSKHQ